MTATQTTRSMFNNVRLGRPSPRTALAALALALATSGVAVAAIPGSDQTVKVCRNITTGALRAVDETVTACAQQESPRPIQLAVTDTTGKVSNADRLDGLDSSKFLGATAKAADADKLDGLDSSKFLGATAKAADADKLDGLDSSKFLGATAKAADADKLDGHDSSDFVASTRVMSGSATVNRGSADVKLLEAHGVALYGVCHASIAVPPSIEIRPNPGAGVNLFRTNWMLESSGPVLEHTSVTSIPKPLIKGSGRSDFNMYQIGNGDEGFDGSAAVYESGTGKCHWQVSVIAS